MRCARNSHLLLIFAISVLALVQNAHQLKLKYEHGKTWETRATTESQKEFIEKLPDMYPDVLFWSGAHVPQESNSYIFSVPSEKEACLLTELKSEGIQVTEHIESIEYLKNGINVLHGFSLVRLPELPESPASIVIASPPSDVPLAKEYVVNVGGDDVIITVDVSDFEFDCPAQEKDVNQFKNTVSIMQKVKVPNNSSGTVGITLSEAKTLVKSVTIAITVGITLGVNLEVSLSLADLGLGASGGVNLQVQLSETSTLSWSEFDTYAIAKTITIPPWTTIEAYGYVNWLKDIPCPFDAIGAITASLKPFNGTGPPPPPPTLYYCPDGSQWTTCYYDCGPVACAPSCVNTNACSCCSYTLDAQALKNPFVIRDLLISRGYTDFEIVDIGDGKLLLKYKGILVGSFGLDSVFVVQQLSP